LTLAAACVLPIPVGAQAQQSVPVSTPLAASAGTANANKTYDAVVLGMSCKQQRSGRMDCEYKVGKSLRFQIAGVGQRDVLINFFKVDVDEDYFASVASLHGCVMVTSAAARSDSSSSVAFVSPQDGKIYRNWNTCLKTAKK